MTPWKETQNQTPLYRVPPDYPIIEARRRNSGWVQIDFVIDKMGFVTQPSVADTSDGNRFVKESLIAIKKWRYAPKFENGEPVEANARAQLDFKMAN